jgi:uncharacterized protein YbjT (DUF2867 family)
MSTQNKTPMVTVFGATGKVGSQVLKYLSDSGVASRAITRDMAKSKALPFVEWVHGDTNNKAEIFSLLAGSEKIFLNSGVSETMVHIQSNIIDAAKEAGVSHIIKLSTPAASEHSKDRVGEWHWQIQQHLERSDVNWNVLQPQSFMQNWLGDFAKTVRAERKIYATAGDGKRAFTDTRDIGRVAAKLFQSPGKWINQIIPLSGGELVSFYEVADAFSKAVGQLVTYVTQTPEEARDRLTKNGVPDFMVQITLVTEYNQKTGMVEKLLTDHVKQIIESDPFTIYDFAQAYSQVFK